MLPGAELAVDELEAAMEVLVVGDELAWGAAVVRVGDGAPTEDAADAGASGELLPGTGVEAMVELPEVQPASMISATATAISPGRCRPERSPPERASPGRCRPERAGPKGAERDEGTAAR
ncbi:hypothetical protein ABIB25_004337 [Nakamurella sp. UYEF19]|uniref:hypothetical protein n=1 Tax=Nakamurella sp. UYEF19 TaxID=1756392 RepID=UPI0033987850